nr:GNAT family N-acetyltransferase [Pontivivens insulae]
MNRIASREEIALMLEWAAAEGWNPGLDDVDAFSQADPRGFFVREVDGAPIAAISVVNHGDDLAFLGLYLCQPEFRGQGHGYALWHHALAHAGGRTIGLDGVPAQEANYARSGFQRTGASIRYMLDLSGPPVAALDPVVDLGAAIALDRAVNCADREPFMKAWLTDTPTRRSFSLGRETLITLRQCREGAKIGPLIASNLDDAEVLVRGAAAHATGPVFLDIPDANPAAAALAARLGGVETFRTARMYRGTPPATNHTRLFGIATMELG